MADSLEGRAVAQEAFGYFVHNRANGTVAGGMAEFLALTVLVEFSRESERGTEETAETKLSAVVRAVDKFLTDIEALDSSHRDALIDVVCTALNSAASAFVKMTDTDTATKH